MSSKGARRCWAWMCLLACASVPACATENPPGLHNDGGTPIDLGDRPDASVMDAFQDSSVTPDGGATYCGRIGAVSDLSHFALPQTRHADVVAGSNTIDAVFVAVRDEADVVVRQAFGKGDGAPAGEEHILSTLRFGSAFEARATSSPFGGMMSFDNFETGSTRTTTVRAMDVEGAANGDERVLSDSAYPSLRARVTALSSGNFVVAWTEATLQALSGGAPAFVDTRLRYTVVDSSGAPLAETVVVATDAPIRGFTLADGGSDSALVYVLDRSATEGRAQSIYVRPIDESGNLAASALELVAEHTIIDDISAVRVTANTIVAWTEVTASLRSDIHVERVTDEGVLAVERVVTHGTEQGGSPALSLFGAFHLGLVYVGGPSGEHSLRFLELEIDELPKVEASTIAELDLNAPASISLGVSEDRTTLGVAWTQTTSAGSDTQFAVVGCNVLGESADGGWCEPDGGM